LHVLGNAKDHKLDPFSTTLLPQVSPKTTIDWQSTVVEKCIVRTMSVSYGVNISWWEEFGMMKIIATIHHIDNGNDKGRLYCYYITRNMKIIDNQVAKGHNDCLGLTSYNTAVNLVGFYINTFYISNQISILQRHFHNYSSTYQNNCYLPQHCQMLFVLDCDFDFLYFMECTAFWVHVLG
jgi:hypothetical protein